MVSLWALHTTYSKDNISGGVNWNFIKNKRVQTEHYIMWYVTYLTHWGEDKIPPSHRQHFWMHFHEQKVLFLIPLSLKFVPNVPIDNKSALVQVMVWRQIGDKPLSEPILTQFTDAYMRSLVWQHYTLARFGLWMIHHRILPTVLVVFVFANAGLCLFIKC